MLFASIPWDPSITLGVKLKHNVRSHSLVYCKLGVILLLVV
jgi:hypothetical protein